MLPRRVMLLPLLGLVCAVVLRPASATYVDTVLATPGLVGYWQFEVATQANSTVNGLTGEFVGDARVSGPAQGPMLSGLPDNRAVLLDGDRDCIATDLDTEATFGDAATIMAWVYLDVQPSDAGRFFTIAGKSEVGNDLDLQIETDNFTKFYTDYSTATVYRMPLPTQQWVHVAATFDDQADFRRIEVNGTRVASDEPLGPHRRPGTTAFSIGESLVFPGRFFQGRIDEVAVFDRALSDGDIAVIFAAASAPTPTATPTVTPILSATPTATPSVPVCVGDCGNRGEVSVGELILMVNIALGNADPASCPAGDPNQDGAITVNEIVRAVNNSLYDCPGG